MLIVGEILHAVKGVNTLFSGYTRVVGIFNESVWLMQLDVYKKGDEHQKKLFDLEHLKAPFALNLQIICEAIQSCLVQNDLQFDCMLPASEEQLSNSAKSKLENNYALLEPLLAEESLLFDAGFRNRKFASRAKECGVRSRQLRRLYYRYLWGGQTKIALAAKYDNCGSPGEVQRENQGRRGRKGKCKVALPEVRNRLEMGAMKFYLSGMNTLEEAYTETLKIFFLKGMQRVNTGNGKTVLSELIVAEEIRPTYAQFRTVCEYLEHKKGKRESIPRRQRKKKEPWEFRGNARQGLNGPGERFEIDATKLQVQLVSRYGSHKLVGTPTLYVLIDDWSGAIVGYALSLENAGWALARRALHNAFQEKEQVFQRLNLPYSNNDWPCHHLPARLTADRAELLSNMAGVVPEIGIKVEIMPPMCPELKGSVEKAINDVKHGRSGKIPGAYPKMPVRRETDGKSDAAFTLDEMELIIVRQILKINNDPVQIKNIPHEYLRSGNKTVSRIDLYLWGLENCPGHTRILSNKQVYTNLLTKEVASVTRQGINFKSQTYFSEVLAENGYLLKAANGHFKIEIRYDEHLVDQIWFLDDKSNDWVVAQVTNEEVRRLKIAFFELESFYADAKQLVENTRLESIHQNQEAVKRDEAMIKEAVIKAKAARGDIGKTEGKAKIRLNRRIAITADRLNEGQNAVESYASAITMARQGNNVQDDDEDNDIPNENKLSLTAMSKNIWRRRNERAA